MGEHPILFSAPMVRAILDGRKTQTRRVVKPLIDSDRLNADQWPAHSPFVGADGIWRWMNGKVSWTDNDRRCPYGAPGDRLWVRETWRGPAFYDDTPPREIPTTARISYLEQEQRSGCDNMGKVRPGIFLPRWASRLTLEITEVRVQRLQEISAKDILAEGAVLRPHDDQFGHNPVSAFDGRVYMDLKSLWAHGWNGINGKRAPSASNPWVWAITFKPTPPEPSLER